MATKTCQTILAQIPDGYHGVFQFLLIFPCLSYSDHVKAKVINFQEKLTIIRGCLRKVFLDCVCVCALRLWPKFTFAPLHVANTILHRFLNLYPRQQY